VQKVVEHNLPFVFTDGHAVDGLSGFYEQKDLPTIDKILDKKAIDATYWHKDDDLELKPPTSRKCSSLNTKMGLLVAGSRYYRDVIPASCNIRICNPRLTNIDLFSYICNVIIRIKNRL
jgi:hypothetical protein